MNRIIHGMAVVSLIAGLSAWMPGLAECGLRIVTTTTDLASIAGAVGGSRVSVFCLQDGTSDPHFLQARPSYIAQARRADLWIRIGMELEVGYEPVILESCRNGRIQVGSAGHLDVSTGVLKLDVPAQRVDRSMGDVHAQGNPHYWLDPYNGRIVAEEIVERLKLLDPGSSGSYESGLAAFKKNLDTAMFGEEAVEAVGGERLWELQIAGTLDGELDSHGITAAGWHGILKPFRNNDVASHHRSWNYLLDRFGLVLAFELEPKPGIPPSSRHLSDVVEIAKERHVRAILVEPFYDRKPADFVAERTGAAILVCANSMGGQKEAADYLSMLDHAVQFLAAGLSHQANESESE